jgi:hypothetical protein
MDKSTTLYDDEFGGIQGLTWLPWVGQRYSERPTNHRLLIVGESHYYIGKTTEEREASRKKSIADSNMTREQVSDSHIYQGWTTKTLTNIPKLLFNTTEIDRMRFWGDSAYYNFVQRPMNYHREEGPEKPGWDDWVAGWTIFSEIARIIGPSHCVFIGVSPTYSFDFSMTNQNLTFEPVSKHPQIGGVSPRIAQLKIEHLTTKLIFVHHLSRCKSTGQWHDYLKSEHPDFMTWLGAESYCQ